MVPTGASGVLRRAFRTPFRSSLTKSAIRGDELPRQDEVARIGSTKANPRGLFSSERATGDGPGKPGR